MSSIFRLFVLLQLFAATALPAQSYVPPDLQDWQQWVLQDQEFRTCPFYFNRRATERADFVCAWPGELELSATASGGRFSQSWTVYAEEQWVALPGGVEYWPEQVVANDRAVEVVARGNVPSVRLTPGSYRLGGEFGWDQRPGVLPIPAASGLVSLTVDGRQVERPEIAKNGVYLGERKRTTRTVDSVTTTLHRLIADEVPTRLITRLQIDVSGGVREEAFESILPSGFVPLDIDSQLPAKLESDGNLRLQVRPGRWTIFVSARGPGVVNALSLQPPGANMPASEIWSYQSNDRLRVTAAEGLPPVDPRQVQVPQNWNNYPAFRVEAGGALTIVERSRGIVSASNELQLSRTMWLDFDGSGYVVLDRIGGQMQSDWRLDMQRPYALLSATEGGENLLITGGRDEGLTGVEVRRTAVDLQALGRSETRGEMPASGWDSRFAEVRATLHLPPGHKLLAAPGVDVARGSWVSQWQLLDFFLVLIITIAVMRLMGAGAAVIAGLAMVLSVHEMFAPGWLWLNLLVAIALMRVAPAGRLRQLVSSYQVLSAVALVIMLVPFIASQLRIALYPQLEPQYNEYQLYDYGVPATVAVEQESNLMEQAAKMRRSSDAVTQAGALLQVPMTDASKARDFARYAPNAIVQAGPGIPSWQWNSYSLSWTGPLDAAQTMRLIVLPRWLVSTLRFAAVLLLLLFAAVLAAEVFKKRWSLPGGLALGRGGAASALAVTMMLMMFGISAPAEADIPDATLLQQLKDRLLEPPDCAPRCAEIVAADVDIAANAIAMTLRIDALEEVAVPLPGSADGWHPDAVRTPAAASQRVFRGADGMLWVKVAAGSNTLTLRGAVPAADSLEIPFPTAPRVIRVNGNGWEIAGIKDRRLLSGSLQLTRLQTDADGDPQVRWESSRFPAFASIERTVELDLDWRVTTTVSRIAPMQGAVTLDVPLIEGESIVSGDFTVSEGRVLVSMSPQQHVVTWTSNLPRRSPLTLTANDGASWKEVWRFAVGNIWNAEFAGIPESDAGNTGGDVRIAEFHPRAGESLTLDATRPAAVSGSTLAFDAVNLAVTHGRRSSDAVLRLNYRSTSGAQHVIQLPTDAEVTAVAIDNQAQTLRAEGGALTVPILPGEHSIQIDWRKSGEMSLFTATPNVDIGAPASNITMSLTRPNDRWLLGTKGPELGPAVLYWSELAALILFAMILGRVGLAPLTSRHWLLLGIGFSTFSWAALGIVAVWLLACGAREKWQPDVNWWRFNLIQVGIGGLTIIALLFIVTTLPAGLLGTPDMQVAGNNSYGNVLGWFADRSMSNLPVATAITAPLWVYKALILAWALWLSFALLRWLPWVWQCFSSHGFWRSRTSA